jgi:hypothetical protein
MSGKELLPGQQADIQRRHSNYSTRTSVDERPFNVLFIPRLDFVELTSHGLYHNNSKLPQIHRALYLSIEIGVIIFMKI